VETSTGRGFVVSVNVGRPRVVDWCGRAVRTAIFKEPVAGAVLASGVNLAGDDQADRRVHGGHDKAVYAYSVEDYRWWAGELGYEPAPGTFGENLTTTGVDLTGAAIGDRWSVGAAVLEIAQPRQPCFKLGIRMGDAGFVERFDAARRPGAYLRIIEPGLVSPGDEITATPAAAPTVRIGELLGDVTPELLARIVADRRVPGGWRKEAERTLRRVSGRAS
jgi:MOSC domain-containing protein YiiM